MTLTTIVVAAALALACVVTLVVQHQRLATLTDSVGPARLANRQVQQAMAQAETAISAYRLTDQQTLLQPYVQAKPVLAAGLADLQSRAGAAGVQDPVATQAAAVDQWLTAYADPVTRGRTPNPAETRAYAEAFAKFGTVNAEIDADLTARSAELTRRSGLTTGLSVAVVLLLGLLGSAVAVTRGRRTLHVIGPPLDALRAVVEARRAGDTDARADPSRGVAEIGDVAAAVNELVAAGDRQRDRLTDDLDFAEALRNVGLAVRESLDLGEVVDRSVRPLTSAFEARAAWVRAFEGEGELPGRGRGARYPSQLTTLATPVATAAARRTAEAAWAARQAVVISPDRPRVVGLSTTADGAAMLAFVARFGADSLLLAPIGVGAECLGYLIVVRGSDQPRWTAAETTGALKLGRDLGRAVIHARLYEREQQLVAQMRALDARKNEFVSTVSHELRTPLSSILGHLELVRGGEFGELTADVDASLAAVDRNSRRLAVLIEDLLLLSRVEEGVQPTKLRPLDLDVVARDVVAAHTAVADRQGVGLSYRSVGATPIRGDRAELERVVGNLVTNAVKFSPPGSPVDVVLDQAPGPDRPSAVLRVVDRGLGISAPDQQQLFTRFFRSTNPAAHVLPGTGLGLAVTKLIVEKHRGRIDVTSVAGAGSTFSVTLALDPTPPDGVPPVSEPAAADVGRHSSDAKEVLT